MDRKKLASYIGYGMIVFVAIAILIAFAIRSGKGPILGDVPASSAPSSSAKTAPSASK